MREVYQKIVRALTDGQALVLASLAGHSGSTPRETGSRMLVWPDGSICGSVGGGKLEAVAIERAKTAFQEKRSCVGHFELTTDEVAGLGMACGGAVTLFLQYLEATAENIGRYRGIAEALANPSEQWLVTTIADGQCTQELTETPEVRTPNRAVLLTGADGCRLIEPVSRISRAVIFGAGHIGFALAPVLDHIDFGITVVDDRADFANRARFPMAAEVLVCDVAGAFSRLAIDADSYLIIVTRGHKYDQAVLERALQTGAGYIGMIGSRKKVAAVLDNLRGAGVSEQQLARVHAPIGLPIGAQTPEEIAVSIAAEMIGVRVKRNGA